MSQHKRFSPSAAYRDLACPGALALIESLPAHERDSGETVHTRRGTCAHTVAELCLRKMKDDELASPEAADYIGMEIEGVLVDDKIAEGAQVYIDYCEELMLRCDTVEIEQRHDMVAVLEDFHTGGLHTTLDGTDMGGTADFVGLEAERYLHIVDYKNGFGLVEVENNPQLLSYGVQTAFNLPALPATIQLTIVQPNALHLNGPIRSWEINVAKLTAWAHKELLPGYEKCLQAVNALATGGLSQQFIDKYIIPGEKQCQWCPVKQAGKCPAHDNYIMQSGLDLLVTDDVSDIQLPLVSSLTEAQERLLLDNTDKIITFLHDIRARRHRDAERGHPTKGWKLVNVNTHRQIRKGMQPAIQKYMKQRGIPAHEFLDQPKMVSPAKLEKLLKKKGVDKDDIELFKDEYFFKPDGGTRFVPDTAAGKPVQDAIDVEFEELFDTEEDLLA